MKSFIDAVNEYQRILTEDSANNFFVNARDYSHLRPLHGQVLLRPLSTPEQTAGGLYLLGREGSTIGEVLRYGATNFRTHHYLAQWQVDANYDLKQFEGLVLLPKDQINFLISRDSGKAWPLNDRLFVEPLSAHVEHTSNITLLKQAYASRWGKGRIVAHGIDAHSDLRTGDVVLYRLDHFSEVRFDSKTYYIVRSAHVEATIE